MKRNFPRNEEHREAYLAEQRALMGDVVTNLERSIKKEARIYKLIAALFIIVTIATIMLFAFLTSSL